MSLCGHHAAAVSLCSACVIFSCGNSFLFVFCLSLSLSPSLALSLPFLECVRVCVCVSVRHESEQRGTNRAPFRVRRAACVCFWFFFSFSNACFLVFLDGMRKFVCSSGVFHRCICRPFSTGLFPSVLEWRGKKKSLGGGGGEGSDPRVDVEE